MSSTVDWPGFAAPLTGPEVGMEDFVLNRIRHPDKNSASTEQPGISLLRPKPMLYLRGSHTAIATVLGVLCGPM